MIASLTSAIITVVNNTPFLYSFHLKRPFLLFSVHLNSLGAAYATHPKALNTCTAQGLSQPSGSRITLYVRTAQKLSY